MPSIMISKVVRNKEYCLIYEKPISEHGLIWKDLVDWWRDENHQDNPWTTLYDRLLESLESGPERLLFQTYFREFMADEMPSLLPQVYLHYDPYTIKQLSNGKRLPRQRMDFLMLLPKNVRIVLEIDGKQHYSVEVNPHGTSQYCSRCGAKGERFSYRGGTRLIAKWGKLFFCPSCRYEANADFNASANVHHSFFHELHWQPRIMRSG